MKIHIFLAIILICIGLIATNSTSSVNYKSKKNIDEEVISVLIYLKNQVDLYSINNQMNKQRASLKERHETIVLALQDTASTSQIQLLKYLSGLQDQDIVKEIQCFWIGT